MKIIDDLFKEDGKWSRKNFSGAISFVFAMAYEVLPIWFDYAPNQYVFDGMLIYSAAALGLTLVGKMNMFKTEKSNADQTN